MTRLRPFVQIASVAVLLFVWAHIGLNPWFNDAHNYWIAWTKPEGLYGVPWLADTRSFVYSPAFAQAWWPVQFIPWSVAWAAWTALQLAALAWMVTPLGAVLALAFPWPYLEGFGTAVYATVSNGNPMVLAAAGITLAMTRHPGWWAVILLTKVSAGIGVLYHLLRGEWRVLASAAVITGAVVAVSVVIAPALWIEWIRDVLIPSAFHTGSAEALGKELFVPVPMPVRATVGLAVVLVAGWRGWPWLVPVGSFLALPDIHLGGFAVLVAAPAVYLRTRSKGA